jgi:hypothetical protein
MNIFELNILASPVGGLLGGIAACRDQGAAKLAVSAVGGAAIGIGLYFGLVGLGVLVEKIANRGLPQSEKKLDRAGFIFGVVVLFPMIALPFLSAFIANSTFKLLF